MIKKRDLEALLDVSTQEVANLLVDALTVAANCRAQRADTRAANDFEAASLVLDEGWKWDGDLSANYELDDDIIQLLRNPEER